MASDSDGDDSRPARVSTGDGIGGVREVMGADGVKSPDRSGRRVPRHVIVLALATVLAVALPFAAHLATDGGRTASTGIEVDLGSQKPIYLGTPRSWQEIQTLQRQGKALFVVSATTDNGPVTAAFDTLSEQETFLRSLQSGMTD